MIKLLFDAYQLYSEFSHKKQQTNVKKKVILVALLYAVVSMLLFCYLRTEFEYNMAVTMSTYAFVIGELMIGLYFYKQAKSAKQSTILESAQLAKNLIPGSLVNIAGALTKKQQLMLVGASVLLLMFIWPRGKNQQKS